MKPIILALFSMFLLAACAHTKKDNIKCEDVLLVACPIRITGCADRIKTDKTDYLIDPVTEDAKKNLAKITKKRKNSDFKEIKVTVQGYTVKEKGHFPNPMAEFDVFKLEIIKTR
ncbi:MAG: hypothetical protein NTY22_05265 [Proteobacteria bacterium]|nr:hypothetical protein [Pseudomonadota bacterium]